MSKTKAIAPPKAPGYMEAIAPYEPGKPIEELERELNIYGSIKLASNENPLGPPECIREIITGRLGKVHRYPDGAAFELTARLAEKLHVRPENLVLGNGSDEIIQMLVNVYLLPGDEAVMSEPSFLMYEIAVAGRGALPVKVPLAGFEVDLEAMLAAVTEKTKMIFVNNPVNPTGAMITKVQLDDLLSRLPENVMVVLDEAYIEFATDPSIARGTDYLGRDGRVVTLRTFSKIYGLAGLRVGYGIMAPEIAGYLNRIRLPFNVNSLAQAAAVAALSDDSYVRKTVSLVKEGLAYFYKEMDRLGLPFHRSQANFLIIELGRDAKNVFQRLLRRGVIVRALTSYGFPQCIRVSVGLAEENQRFVAALADVLKEMD
ncbi:MAG: histidinol-phosphate transaminase [Thermodesulfobacteriota bacterium]